jgi:hypothetical protein
VENLLWKRLWNCRKTLRDDVDDDDDDDLKPLRKAIRREKMSSDIWRLR